MANPGQCLCGEVRWEFDGDPHRTYNCHCKMCRKAHGAAYGTYWFLNHEQFRWVGGNDAIVDYSSSNMLTRGFCGTCGSVVPYAGTHGDHVVTVGGCHDDGKSSDCEIFVAHKAPWFDITSALPRFDDYPPDTGYQRVEELPMEPAPEGIVRGSCLCGAVVVHVDSPFRTAHNCHCRRCRRARAAAHASNGFTAMDAVTIIQGREHLKSYKVPGAKFFTQVFCDICGSKMPRLDPDRGVAVIPLGCLDDDPGIRPVDHIFVADKASWDEITGDLPQFAGAPT